MTEPVRFSYADPAAVSSSTDLVAYLPITSSRESRVLTVSGLLDSGSSVNVLPYLVGQQLGLDWEQQTIPVVVKGN